VALTLTSQRSSPLKLDLVTNPVQPLQTLMQSEVLVEASQHDRQLMLLNAPFPMHVLV